MEMFKELLSFFKKKILLLHLCKNYIYNFDKDK